ncbi:hypothetical protein KAW44_04080 [Candidatus Bipolaricaulota bacterium]|nr:hypothetical protein [Candidatus Bipolaricaulota bacterium]
MHLRKHNKRAGTHAGLLRFAGLFLVFFVLIALIWPLVTPVYNALIVGIARPVFSLVERPDVTVVKAQGGSIFIYRDEPGMREPAPFSDYSRYVYFGLVPLLALFFATPNLGRWKRAQLTLMGFALLASFHVIYLVGSVELTYVFVGCSEVGTVAYRFLDWMQVLLRILWEVSPVIIWMLLTFKYWGRQLLGSKRTASPPYFPNEIKGIEHTI